MEFLVKHTESQLTLSIPTRAIFVQSDDYFKMIILDTTGTIQQPAITENEGKSSCTFLLRRYQRAFILYEGRDFTFTLRIDGFTPVIEHQVENCTIEIREEPFQFFYDTK